MFMKIGNLCGINCCFQISKTSFYFKMVVVNVICFMGLTNERWFIRIVYVVVWLSHKENDYGYFHNLEK